MYVSFSEDSLAGLCRHLPGRFPSAILMGGEGGRGEGRDSRDGEREDS